LFVAGVEDIQVLGIKAKMNTLALPGGTAAGDDLCVMKATINKTFCTGRFNQVDRHLQKVAMVGCIFGYGEKLRAAD
jgi:hypothetical protein